MRRRESLDRYEAGSGPLAVFVHGFPLDHRIWEDQVRALGDIRRCVALDLPGFGRSPTVTAEILTMESMAENVAAVISQEGGEADVVALSMGGYVALALWESAPELVRRLVLVDTRAEADPPEAKQARDEMAENVLTHGRDWLASEMTPKLLGPEAGALPRARVRTMIESVSYEAITASLAGMRDRLDRRFLLHSISVPTLVMVGAQDQITPPETVRTMAAEIPGARFVEIEEAGHLPPVEQPEDVTAVLRAFWDQ